MMSNLYSNWFERPYSNGLCLPSEILSHIFSFLKLDDRKNVRLTCTQWYYACNTKSIVQREKMCILSPTSHDNGTKSWFNVLMDSPRSRFNLELISLQQLPPDERIFWQTLGSRVESLKIEAPILMEFGRQMIKFCNNLEKLHIHVNELQHAMDCILSWNELCIFHDSLKCLVLEDCHFLTDCHFSRLFRIYPCIQKLELINTRVNCHKRVDSRFYKDTSQFDSDSIFSFSCVFAQIRSKAENIKTLVFDRIGDSGLLDNWFEELASLPGLKLNELKLRGHPHLTRKAFIKFFTHQTSLECINIFECSYFSLICFLHMIRKCSNLKTINVECSDRNPAFLMSKEIFHALTSLPHLKILELTGMFFMEENVNVNRDAPINATGFQCLRELTLKMPAIYFDIFLPKISNLTALHVVPNFGWKGVTDANLQVIFDKGINLRSLKLSLDSSVSDFGFTGCRIKSPENQIENSGISINRLKKLEILSLIFNNGVESSITGAENSITDALFSHFIFPNLRKLELVCFPIITEKGFTFLSQNTPFMEYCKFIKCGIEDKAMMKFEEGWKSLNCFKVGGYIHHSYIFDTLF